MRQQNLILNTEDDIIFLSHLGEDAKIKSLQLFEELRALGFNVRQSFLINSLKKQLEEATEMGAKTNLILGKKDFLTPPFKANDLINSFKDPLVKEIHDSGHTLMVESPNTVLDYLIEIL